VDNCVQRWPKVLETQEKACEYLVNISHLRTYQADKTTGRLIIEGEFKGATLEDIGRPHGIKIPNETCIPEGVYRVAITQSARFGRRMILLYTNPKDYTCDLEGIVYSGVRCHGGQKTSQTSACLLMPDPISLRGIERIIDEALKVEQVTWTIARE
jgi:hypothetical protein